MATEGLRHAEITPFDHGALIQIPAWFLMVSMILATFLKLAIRFKTTRNPGLDDAVCFVGMVGISSFLGLLERLLMNGIGSCSVLVKLLQYL